jgi:hypothetical protein
VPSGGRPAVLPINRVQQDETNWCWAACCLMVFNAAGQTADKQCDLATKLFGGQCCNSPDSCTCDQGAWPNDAYAAYQYNSQKVQGTVPIETIKQEIDADRPVRGLSALEWAGRRPTWCWSPAITTTGALDVLDPANDGKTGQWTYDQLCSAFGNGNWEMTWTGIQRAS